MNNDQLEIPIIVIKNLIENIKITDGLPENVFASDKIIKEITNLYSQKKFITSGIVSDVIVTKTLHFYKNTKYKDDKPADGTLVKNLTDIDTTALALDIHKCIISLPREYVFVFPLPKFVIPNNPKYKENLCHNVRLESVTEDFINKYKLQKPKLTTIQDYVNNLSLLNRNQYNVGESILNVKLSGYVTRFGEMVKNDLDPLYIFKIVFSIFEMNEMFKLDYSQSLNNSTYKYDVFDIDSSELIKAMSEPNETFKLIQSHQFLDLTNTQNLQKFNNIITDIKYLLTKNDTPDLKEYQKLKVALMNALYWYFELIKTDNIHLKTIFLVTAIDSFFKQNDPKEIKIDYISSIIGRSLQTQKIIKRILEGVFKERNEIIHGEKQIDSSDNNAFTIDDINTPLIRAHLGNHYLKSLIQNKLKLYLESTKMLDK